MTSLLMLLALASVGTALYRYSLWRNPYRPCHWCGERPKRSGAWLPWTRGACTHCGGSGWAPRAGTTFINRKHK